MRRISDPNARGRCAVPSTPLTGDPGRADATGVGNSSIVGAGMGATKSPRPGPAPLPHHPGTCDARGVRILLIDHHDSFTNNLVALVEEAAGVRPEVVPHDSPDERLLDGVDAVVLSPGPGTPTNPGDLGLTSVALRRPDLPILGVCLGFQAICHACGAEVIPAADPVHGTAHPIHHDGTGLFAGLPSPFPAMRYHSLVVRDPGPPLRVTARLADGTPMAVAHASRPWWGVQFHPESVESAFGGEIIAAFLGLARRRRGLRVSHRAVPARDPAAVFAAVFGDADHAVWLDGGRHGLTIMGAPLGDLGEILIHDATTRTTDVRRGGVVADRVHGDFLPYLDARSRALAVRDRPTGLPPGFVGGFAGWLGYELGAQTVGVVAHPSPRPDALQMFLDRAVVLDPATDTAHLLALAPAGEAPAGGVPGPPDTGADPGASWVDAAAATLHALPAPTAGDGGAVVRPVAGDDPELPAFLRHDRAEYVAMIAEVDRRIRAGDTYEVNLTNAVSVPGSREPFEVFLRLRTLSPDTPFNAYVRAGDIAVAGASPERFLRVEADGTVLAEPIKGTRPRSTDAAADHAAAAELAASAKDRAENVMIVDLMRHDLRRACIPASVVVPEVCAVRTFAAVHQSVSTITGRLAPGRGAVDAVAAAFPPGSMTGAPKERTMRIIAELEGAARGVYSGALGYFSADGSADLSVVIRSIVLGPDGASIGVGGAITVRSDPDAEFAETLVKARTPWRALGTHTSSPRPAPPADPSAIPTPNTRA